MRCPTCRKPLTGDAARIEKNGFYPFCSERCRLIDLGRWLDGDYCISESFWAEETVEESENAADNYDRG